MIDATKATSSAASSVASSQATDGVTASRQGQDQPGDREAGIGRQDPGHGLPGAGVSGGQEGADQDQNGDQADYRQSALGPLLRPR